jgi:hypothetical protein
MIYLVSQLYEDIVSESEVVLEVSEFFHHDNLPAEVLKACFQASGPFRIDLSGSLCASLHLWLKSMTKFWGNDKDPCFL